MFSLLHPVFVRPESHRWVMMRAKQSLNEKQCLFLSHWATKTSALWPRQYHHSLMESKQTRSGTFIKNPFQNFMSIFFISQFTSKTGWMQRTFYYCLNQLCFHALALLPDQFVLSAWSFSLLLIWILFFVLSLLTKSWQTGKAEESDYLSKKIRCFTKVFSLNKPFCNLCFCCLI